jgi:hypothetical protein
MITEQNLHGTHFIVYCFPQIHHADAFFMFYIVWHAMVACVGNCCKIFRPTGCLLFGASSSSGLECIVCLK